MSFKKQNPCKILPSLLLSLALSACSEQPETLLASAKDYLAKNDNKAALIQIKNALQRNPDLPEARYLLGQTLLEQGDPVGAELELRKALALKHPAEQVVPLLATALLAQGQARKLTDEWAQLELRQPASKASLQLSLATAYAQLGKPENSQAALRAALQADPAYVPALLAQARQLAAQQDFAGALQKLEGVIAQFPASFEAWKYKGDLLLYWKKQTDDALLAYRKSVEINPRYVAGHVAIIGLMMQQNNLPEAGLQIEKLKGFAARNPQTLYLAAQLAFQKKDYKQAHDLVQQVLRVAPDNVQSLQLAGAVAFQLNSLGTAQDYLSRALSAAPGLPLARRLLAMTYLRSGQPDQALSTLQPGLSRSPGDPELLSVAGEVYLHKGDVKQAQAYFEKASQSAPQDAKKRTALALSRLVSGQADLAFDELQAIAVSDTGTTADLALISAYLKRREFDKALNAIDSLEKKQPQKPLATFLRAQIRLAQQDLPGARKGFERALAMEPAYFSAAASLATLDMQDKQPDNAKKRFEGVLKADPKNGPALLALAELAARTGATPEAVAKLIGNAIAANPSNLAPHLMLIDWHLRHQNVKAASSAAQFAMAALPGNAEVLDALGKTQQASGELNQATTTYTQLASQYPQSPQPHLRLADIHLVENDMPAAQQSLRKALEIKPDLLNAQRALITLQIKGGAFQDAMATARTVEKQRPKEPVGYVLEGDIQAAQKKWDAAAQAYRAGLKLSPEPELAVKLHAVLMAGAKRDEAEQFSALWQKEHPKEARFLFYLGDMAMARSDWATAEKNYAAVTQLQPQQAVAFNNLAWVSAKLNKAQALAYAEKANALAPNQPAFMDTLAMILSAQGQYVKALEWQKKALALQPQNPLFKLNLAKIHIKGEQKDLARPELEALSKLGNKFSAQPEVASLLKQL